MTQSLRQRVFNTLRHTARLAIIGLGSAASVAMATDLDDTNAYPGAPIFPSDYLWIDAGELAALPDHGTAWDNMLEAAEEKTRGGNLADQDDQTNTNVLAKALIYARTGDASIRKDVIKSVMNIRGSEDNEGGTTLALGKELLSYVLAADLVKLPKKKDARFKAWLKEVMVKEYPSGKTLVSTHEVRPNNWGTFAGASRIAAAAYLQDEAEVARAAKIFKAWLGDRDLYSDFKFKEVDWWQYEPDYPVAINPLGATKEGHNIDGALPDDMRRGGEFSWPPPKENYVYSALQGAVAQAVLLDRLGYDVWNWEDRALLRAFTWLNEVADYPAVGDDTWQPYIINKVYGTHFETTSPTKPGKNVGWADWTHPGEDDADVEIPAECMIYLD